MFTDKVKLVIRSGRGGNGCVSFRREKYIPRGGPDGGDGGKGGDIILLATKKLDSLAHLKYKKMICAKSGENGSKRNCSGKNAEDIVIEIPIGTFVKTINSDEIILDLCTDNQKEIIAKGGTGGRGNQHFATSRNRAPRYAEKGGEEKELEIILELKSIADISLIGLPNVGKSSLLAAMTNATPKIGNYCFTTLYPNLGIINSLGNKKIILADIPGIISGASSGIGLGYEFLRHIERTKTLFHVVDLTAHDIISNIKIINIELEKYKKELIYKEQVIIGNKIDVIQSEDNINQLNDFCKEKKLNMFLVSAKTHYGIEELTNYILDNI
jgi:GTP-binding protein